MAKRFKTTLGRLRTSRRVRHRHTITFAMLLANLYIAGNLVASDRGILAAEELERTLTDLRDQRHGLQKNVADIQNEVQGLRPNSLDSDLLVSKTRQTLGLDPRTPRLDIHRPSTTDTQKTSRNTERETLP